MHVFPFCWSLTNWRKQHSYHSMFRIIDYFMLLFPLFPFPWRERKLKSRRKQSSEIEPEKLMLWNLPESAQAVKIGLWYRNSLCCLRRVSFLSVTDWQSTVQAFILHCSYLQANLHSSYSYWFMVFFLTSFFLLPTFLLAAFTIQLSRKNNAFMNGREIWSFLEEEGKKSFKIQLIKIKMCRFFTIRGL